MKKIILIAGALILLACIGGVVILYMQTSATQEKFQPLIDACRGNQVAEAAPYSQTSGTHPSMGVIERASGTLQIYTYAVPDDALAESVAETQLVLCLTEPKEVLIESCPYAKGDATEADGVVERYVYERELTLVEAKTGKVLASEVLKGDDPRECLEQESFRKGENTVKVKGAEIADAHMQEWMRPYAVIK